MSKWTQYVKKKAGYIYTYILYIVYMLKCIHKAEKDQNYKEWVITCDFVLLYVFTSLIIFVF